MIALLDQMALLSDWFFALPRTAVFLVYGLLTAYTIAAGGFALARSGIRPLWVLLLIVPTLNLLAIWVWAHCRWPAFIKKD